MPVTEPKLNYKQAAHLLSEREGETISSLARAIGEDRSQLSLILSGKRNGGLRIIRKLAEYFEVDPDVLVAPNVYDVRAVVVRMARELGVTAEELADAS